MTYEFRYEFMYMKNMVKSYMKSGGTQVPDGDRKEKALEWESQGDQSARKPDMHSCCALACGHEGGRQWGEWAELQQFSSRAREVGHHEWPSITTAVGVRLTMTKLE